MKNISKVKIVVALPIGKRIYVRDWSEGWSFVGRVVVGKSIGFVFSDVAGVIVEAFQDTAECLTWESAR